MEIATKPQLVNVVAEQRFVASEVRQTDDQLDLSVD